MVHNKIGCNLFDNNFVVAIRDIRARCERLANQIGFLYIFQIVSMNFVCDVKANMGLFLKILLMGDNFESVLDAEVLCSVIEHGLSLNGDLSWEEWLDDGGDLWEDQGLGAVGVLVSVESGVKGEGAGLASWGEGFAVLGGDQSQKVIGVVLAGSDADGKSRDLEIRLIIQPSYFQGQGLQSITRY